MSDCLSIYTCRLVNPLSVHISIDVVFASRVVHRIIIITDYFIFLRQRCEIVRYQRKYWSHYCQWNNRFRESPKLYPLYSGKLKDHGGKKTNNSQAFLVAGANSMELGVEEIEGNISV